LPTNCKLNRISNSVIFITFSHTKFDHASDEVPMNYDPCQATPFSNIDGLMDSNKIAAQLSIDGLEELGVYAPLRQS
jgi:hypothetical protein